jgi:hypothetical protein
MEADKKEKVRGGKRRLNDFSIRIVRFWFSSLKKKKINKKSRRTYPTVSTVANGSLAADRIAVASGSARMSRSIVAAMVLAGITAVHGWKVQIVPKTTSVKYVVPVVTSFTTVSSTCYVPVNVTGVCRRRRSVEERPDVFPLDDNLHIEDILPTLPR